MLNAADLLNQSARKIFLWMTISRIIDSAAASPRPSYSASNNGLNSATTEPMQTAESEGTLDDLRSKES